MTLPLADDWPSFADELGRKVSEQLRKWSNAYNAGRITKREFFILVHGLYDATSGMAPRDVSELLADIHKELRHGNR